MKKIAQINNNKISNIALYEDGSNWITNDDLKIDVTEIPGVNIGWIYSNGTLSAPPVEEDEE